MRADDRGETRRAVDLDGQLLDPFRAVEQPFHESPRNVTTWFESTQPMMTKELTTRNPTVPMPLATPSETRSIKLLPPAYGDSCCFEGSSDFL